MDPATVTLCDFAAVHFTDTITLGSIVVGILLGIAGLSAFAYGVRWKSAAQVADATVATLREGREAYRVQSERLQGELLEASQRLKELEATRSLEPVLQAIVDGFHRMELRFQEHEERAQERHQMNQRQGEAHLAILERIADALAQLGVKNGDH